MSITNYLSEMREIMGGHSDTTPENQADRVEELVKKSFTTAKLNQTKNLGLLFEDDKALYWGLLQNIAAENGEIKNMLGFMGITLVKGKGVNIYLWKKYTGDRSVLELELLIKSLAASLQNDNQNDL